MSELRLIGMLMAIPPWGLITMPWGLQAQIIGLCVQLLGMGALIAIWKAFK